MRYGTPFWWKVRPLKKQRTLLPLIRKRTSFRTWTNKFAQEGTRKTLPSGSRISSEQRARPGHRHDGFLEHKFTT